jgi:TRAP-type C4-dicarboxylate transport system permease small subunit
LTAVRRAFDALYDAAAYLAALLLIGTLVSILLGIFGRLFDFQVRGSDAYAGYLMAGSGFLALAHTLKRGEHIRVTVVSRLLKGHAHKLLELIAIGIAVLLAIVLAWFSVRLVWLSYTLHDISTGNDATPLWLPEFGMALGTLIFAVAVIDEFQLELRGRRVEPKHDDVEPLHIE